MAIYNNDTDPNELAWENDRQTKISNLYEQYAKYILHESSEPVNEIEWLIENLQPEVLEDFEETMKMALGLM